jgi:restriction endonuclease S subunit
MLLKVPMQSKLYRLDDIAEVRTVQLFRDKPPAYTAVGNACAISIREIVGKWPLDITTLPRLQLEQGQFQYTLKSGDILLPARGDNYPARLFNEMDQPVIPVGHVTIITANDYIDSGYLAWYLNRQEFQKKIENSLTGTSIKSLNKSKLLTFEVQVPAMEVQQSISQVQSISTRRLALQQQKLALEKLEIETVCTKLLFAEMEI